MRFKKIINERRKKKWTGKVFNYICTTKSINVCCCLYKKCHGSSPLPHCFVICNLPNLYIYGSEHWKWILTTLISIFQEEDHRTQFSSSVVI